MAQSHSDIAGLCKGVVRAVSESKQPLSNAQLAFVGWLLAVHDIENTEKPAGPGAVSAPPSQAVPGASPGTRSPPVTREAGGPRYLLHSDHVVPWLANQTDGAGPGVTAGTTAPYTGSSDTKSVNLCT